MCRYIWDMGYTSRDGWREWPQGETLGSWAVGGRLTITVWQSGSLLSSSSRLLPADRLWAQVHVDRLRILCGRGAVRRLFARDCPSNRF